MARATTTTSRTGSKRAPEPAPKKRLGRPVGSKNRVPTAAKTKAAAASSPKRAVGRKAAAPAAPKMSKADLEAHVVKLERTVARLRKQTAELKQAAQESVVDTKAAKAAKAAVPEKRSKRTAAPKTRRSAKQQTTASDTASMDEADATSAAD